MESIASLQITRPKADAINEESETFQEQKQERSEEISSPILRDISVTDMANRSVLFLVMSLIKSAVPNAPADDALALALSQGKLETFWILTPEGEHAGLVATQCGVDETTRLPCFYIASVAAAPNVTLEGWRKIVLQLRMKARERGCLIMQWDTTPEHERMNEISNRLGAHRSAGPVLNAIQLQRFTLEV